MATVPSVSLSAFTQTEYLSILIDYGVKNNFSVAVWRLPNDSRIHLILSQETQTLPISASLEDLGEGFVVAPFDTSAERVFLKADHIFSFGDNQLNQPVTPLEVSSTQWLGDLLPDLATVALPKIHFNENSKAANTNQDFFLRLAGNALHEINQSTFEKVVVSRSQTFDVGDQFNVVSAYEALCRLYSNALISFVAIPGLGSWMGASPEVLITVENNRTFKTTALAGTQRFIEGTNLKNVAWTQKDIEEQALVERYIISCFKKIRLREYDEHGPRTVVAGNLIHLKSDFTVDLQATNFPKLGSVMLQLLHPTSAVCGVPLDTSLEFIRRHEGYDRQLYAGYLGPVNVANRIDIFVNLRCLQLLPGKVILYAGAGITQDSVPEKEWEETNLKLDTLLTVVNSTIH